MILKKFGRRTLFLAAICLLVGLGMTSFIKTKRPPPKNISWHSTPAVINVLADENFKKDFPPVNFPENFIWGTASSAYQVAGANSKSDWWEWEKTRDSTRVNEATDDYHIHRWYERDFAISGSLGFPYHRFSVDWSQIEPEKGKWDGKEIDHYKKILARMKKHGIEPVICLNHFVLPKWFADEGGWTNPNSPAYFTRFTEKVAREIGRPFGVKIWLTFNEPTVHAICGYIKGEYPPGKKGDWKGARLVLYNISRAHKAAYISLHKICDGPRLKIKVGVAHMISSFLSDSKSQTDIYIAECMNMLSNRYFFEITEDFQDFIGLNYYKEYTLKLNTFSWWFLSEYTKDEISPDGLYRIAKEFSFYKKPIIITENGLNTDNEKMRIKFIVAHLLAVKKAIDEGVDIQGYFVWSLTDTYEWNAGYTTHFGLVGIDRKTQDRVIRKSAFFYGDIIRANSIDPEVVRKYLESPEK